MHRIKYCSEHDLSNGENISRVIEKINCLNEEEIHSFSTLIEMFNILKYLEVNHFASYIESRVSTNSESIKSQLNKKVGLYLEKVGSSYIKHYSEVPFSDVDDFWEIFNKYKIFERTDDNDFSEIVLKDNFKIISILRFYYLVKRYDSIVKIALLNHACNIKYVISKYLDEQKLFLPSSLKDEEIFQLIEDYIDSDNPNINILRKIEEFPKNKQLEIPEKLQLKARERNYTLSDIIFQSQEGHQVQTTVTYKKNIELEMSAIMGVNNIDIIISRDWIDNNLDYPTLWNNFIFLFEIVDRTYRLNLVSKKNGNDSFLDALAPSYKHLYRTNIVFDLIEQKGNVELFSYISYLSNLNIRIEDMITWFFEEYLAIEFSVIDFNVKTPTESSSYGEKCRFILPELEKVFKQFNSYIENGYIYHDLIQFSSSSTKLKDIKSLNDKKYVYPGEDWFNRVSKLLFSDQSVIFYMPNLTDRYKNFSELISNEDTRVSDYSDFQKHQIFWLIENKIIAENNKGILNFVDSKVIYLLKELYFEDVVCYWHLSKDMRAIVDEFALNKIVQLESSLLTRGEQDYFDYYLNKSKFTNGYDLRNSYMHGSNSGNEPQNKRDYYLIIKLFIITILKINDDICTFDKIKQ